MYVYYSFRLHCQENCKKDNPYLINVGKGQFLGNAFGMIDQNDLFPREYLLYITHKSGLTTRQTYETLYKHVIICVTYLCNFMSHLYIPLKHNYVRYCIETVPGIYV